MAYEIFSLATLHCTECQGGVEKQGVPDAMLQINLNDARHLECLAWPVYDGPAGRESTRVAWGSPVVNRAGKHLQTHLQGL